MCAFGFIVAQISSTPDIMKHYVILHLILE